MSTSDPNPAQNFIEPLADSVKDVEVIVVGAGFGGLGMATQLRRRGHASFVLLERADDVGGAWWHNQYPGAACDVPSHLYSFSFRKNPEWSHVYSPQQEILSYLRETARDEQLTPHIQFGAEVVDARWDEADSRWTVRTRRGAYRGKVLINAAGHLSDPKPPAIQGLDTFSGHLFHSAAWNHDVDLEGKRIGVIGTGASAIQIVPELAKVAGHLTVFQRSAPYIIPRNDRPYTEIEKTTFRRLPERIDALRAEIFWASEARFVERQAVPAVLNEVARVALDHIHAQVDDPDLRCKLTPDYQFGCKRILRSDDYYPTLCRSNVTLETSRVARIEGNTVTTVAGAQHELDVLVLATGFEASDLPIAHRITGKDDQLLADQWETGMQAYATTAVHGFPNLFIMNGPHTGTGHNSAIYVIESQISYILGALEYMNTENITAMEVSAEAEADYVQRIEDRSQGTVWLTGGCQSWYLDPRNGRLILWPDFTHTFREENGTFDPAPYLVERTELRSPVPAGPAHREEH
ncbi:NAD(P)/FAD-dependent oxidoreductase [Kribbella sp. NPDC050820]|uniref:flavin-containing monooxygenase n=1 Tax=Kribbella sp. NPDC050820 TaxID=3155408 RepID=UPI0033D76E14